MYAWIWRHLPFGRPGRIIGSVLLVAAAAAILWFGVFPRVESYMPWNDGQITSTDGGGGVGPAGGPGPQDTGSPAPPRRDPGRPALEQLRTGVARPDPEPEQEGVTRVRILVVDNYDSFVFNLVQYLGQLGVECEVRRNDELDLAAVGRLGADGVLLSPGPGTPERAGICMPLIAEYAGRLPIFGVCLGHQAIGAAFGATVDRAPELAADVEARRLAAFA